MLFLINLVRWDKLRLYIFGGFTLKKIGLLILGLPCFFLLGKTAGSSESQTTKNESPNTAKRSEMTEKEKTKVDIFRNETFAA